MGPCSGQFLKLAHAWVLHHRHAEVRVWCEQIERGLLPDSVVRSLIPHLWPLIEEQKRRPNYLYRPPEYEELYPREPPDICIGRLAEDEDVPVGLSFRGNCHCIFTGLADSGKTTAIRATILRTIEHNRQHPDTPVRLLVIENKAGDASDLRELIGEACVHYDAHRGPLIGLNAPHGVPPHLWTQDLVTSLCARCGLQFGGITIANEIMWLLAQLNPDGGEVLAWPDLRMCLDITSRVPPGTFASKNDYQGSVIQVLEGLLTASGDLFSTSDGLDVEQSVFGRAKWACVISMANLSPVVRSFVTDVLLLQLLRGRMARGYRPGRTDCLVCIDEADAYVSALAEEAFPSGMGVCSNVFRLGREFGLGVILGLGEMGLAAPHVLGSAAYHFVFNLKHSRDVFEARNTLRLPPRGEELLPALEQGECVARLAGTWPHAMLCKMDYVPPSIALAAQYDLSPAAPALRLDDLPHVLEALRRRVDEVKARRMRQRKAQRLSLSESARKLLFCAADNPWVPVTDLWRQVTGDPQAKAPAKVVKELTDLQLAAFDTLRVGRVTFRLIEIQERGWQLLNKKSPVIHGRGGICHRHAAHWIGTWAEKQGWKSEIEWLVPRTGHHADVAWLAGGSWHVAEVVITAFGNLSAHLRACFIESSAVATVTIVAPQKQQLAEIRYLVQAEKDLATYQGRILYRTLDVYLEDEPHEGDVDHGDRDSGSLFDGGHA